MVVSPAYGITQCARQRRGRAASRSALPRREVAPADLAEPLVDIGQRAATGRKPFLADLRKRCVVGVADIGEGRFHRLADQLVRIHGRESVVRDEPLDEIGLRDAEGVLQWARGPGGHDVRVGFETPPRARVALDQCYRDDGVHGALDGDAARLALALAGVAVADGTKRALDVDSEKA